MFQDIFPRFTRLHLTQKTDRPVAVTGLADRLETFYKKVCCHGIFPFFLGESLLWQRSGDEWMESLIDFEQETSSWSINGTNVPSWSWMAYKGEISYTTICTDGLTWNPILKLRYLDSRCTLLSPLVYFSPQCHIRLESSTECEIRDENENVCGWIRFDCENVRHIKSLRCISIAQGTACSREYTSTSPDTDLLAETFQYVLIVRRASRKVKDTQVHRRLGVGIVLGRCVLPVNKKHLVLVV